MNRTIGTLFTGAGGADIGAMNAGLTPIWGVEYDPDIAAVARQNLGHDVICADVMNINPHDLPRPNVLHASPPCPNFSTAKAGAEETELDIELAEKVGWFIEVLMPDIFTLENVSAYSESKSFTAIVQSLKKIGYAFDKWVLNAADYGVPQTRKRLIVVARRDGIKPAKPEPTHAKTPTPLFDHRRQWVGWYEAIEDLIPALPETQLAHWQIALSPAALNRTMVLAQGGYENQSATVVCGFGHRPSHMPLALLVDGTGNSYCTKVTIRDSDEPAFTVTASQLKHPARAALNAKTVGITPQCLARFQSFGDNYIWPGRAALAVRMIGNAVPPLMYQRVIESIIRTSSPH